MHETEGLGMSGGGGGGGDFPPPSREIDCTQLSFETTLDSPQPGVESLAVGEVLDVDLREEDGVRNIAALKKSGELMGSITTHLTELLRCIQSGHNFEAEVLDVEDGAVRVRVQAA